MSISSHAKHGPNNGRSMPTGDLALDIKPNDPAASSEEEQIAFVRALRVQTAERYREVFKTATAPIRVMARMMNEVTAEARRAGIPAEILRRELSNRTIGDVNVRMITEKIDGVDYSTIGEDLGLILPGEEIGGRISDGAVHLELNRREEEIERRLLRDYNWDMRVYDVFGVGNPLLREKLAARFERSWGLPVTPEKTYISIGALDALYKCILSLGYHFKKKYGKTLDICLPGARFRCGELAGRGVRSEAVEHAAPMRRTTSSLPMICSRQALADDPELRLLYLTVSNNPTAFSYSPDEIRELYRAIIEDGREFAVLADLAYIGHGNTRSRQRAHAGLQRAGDIAPHPLYQLSIEGIHADGRQVRLGVVHQSKIGQRS